MNNQKIKIVIICPLNDEYDACKEILGLYNESEIPGRIVSERKENNVKVITIKSRELIKIFDIGFLGQSMGQILS